MFTAATQIDLLIAGARQVHFHEVSRVVHDFGTNGQVNRRLDCQVHGEDKTQIPLVVRSKKLFPFVERIRCICYRNAVHCHKYHTGATVLRGAVHSSRT